MGCIETFVGVGVALAMAVGVTTLVKRMAEGVNDKAGTEIPVPWEVLEEGSSGQRPGPVFPSL